MITTALYNEIAHTNMFEMQETAFFNHARMFLTHYREVSGDGRKASDKGQFLMAASSGFAEKVYVGNAGYIARYEDLEEDDVVINVIRMSGPMMRYGGGCAYGSTELREMIMRAANLPQCVAQVFIVDTPGGSSATKDDLQEAMDYAHSKGQKTYMQVDGMVMSAGMAWAAMCTKRYARNPRNMFGCMGTYASFYTNKDKDVNSITQEMFHVVYAEGSPNKNKAFRDSAEGDDSTIQELVNRENERYKEIIRTGIPNVTNEQLLGGEWEAQEVIGTLCDGIRSLDDIINEIVEDNKDKVFNRNSNNNKSHSEQMGKQYDKIQSALGWETLNSGKDNSLWLHEEMADQLTAFVEESEKTQNALEAKQADVNDLVKQIEQLKADHSVAIDEARSKVTEEMNGTIEALKKEKETLEQKMAELQNEIEKQAGIIAEKDKTIEEKNKDIEELSHATAPLPKPGVVNPSQSEEKKVFLASGCKDRTEAKEAHANLMQTLRNRM